MDAVLDLPALDGLFGALRDRGYTVVGPTVRAGSIAFDEVASTADLPGGWIDVQEGGSFRLQRGPDDALFAHTVGHDSLKRWLFPPVVQVWHGPRDGLRSGVPEPAPRYAFVGVRSCDLHAVAIQDRVFLGDRHVEEDYARRRADAFFVAAQCARAGGTCFCASMDTGPRARAGFDLALTEILDEAGHRFGVEVGSDRGAEVLAAVDSRPPDPDERRAPDEAEASARATMGRALDTTDLRDLLFANLEHPRWDDVADRCLSCGNCTMVCPTCFCSAVEDTTDLAGAEADRTQGLGLVLHPRALRAARRERAPHDAGPLPAVDDPQARGLDRPVRHVGLRRLRALHHLVPGRHRPDRGGGGHPGRRRACGRSMSCWASCRRSTCSRPRTA